MGEVDLDTVTHVIALGDPADLTSHIDEANDVTRTVERRGEPTGPIESEK